MVGPTATMYVRPHSVISSDCPRVGASKSTLCKQQIATVNLRIHLILLLREFEPRKEFNGCYPLMKEVRGSVLITGGCGFLGRHLLEKLPNRSVKKVIVDNLQLKLHPGWKNDDSIVFFKEDVRNMEAMKEIVMTEHVGHCIHLAGLTSVMESFKNPKEVVDVNVNGTLSLLRACTQNHVKSFIFASSSAVYGSQNRLPIPEEALCKPLSVYGASKIAAEALVSAYASLIHTTFCLRFFNIYGENMTAPYPTVMQTFKQRLDNGEPLMIHGDGLQTRDFVHVDDAVDCILLASGIACNPREKYRGHNIVLNVGSGRPVSIVRLAKDMQACWRKRSPLIFTKPLLGDIRHSYADVSNCEAILGFKAKISLRDGLLSVKNGVTTKTRRRIL